MSFCKARPKWWLSSWFSRKTAKKGEIPHTLVVPGAVASFGVRGSEPAHVPSPFPIAGAVVRCAMPEKSCAEVQRVGVQRFFLRADLSGVLQADFFRGVKRRKKWIKNKADIAGFQHELPGRRCVQWKSLGTQETLSRTIPICRSGL